MTTLKALGLHVQLGHSPGQSCLLPVPCAGDNFIVLDIDCVHNISVDFCGCKIAQKQSIQLLRAQLYPSTVKYPHAASTFRLLKHYHLVNFESKISDWEFF